MATTTTCKNCGVETFDTRISPSTYESVCRKCYTSELEAENKRLREALKYIIKQMDCPAIQCEGDWQTGMFCGLEDRGIVDRYDACMYGYNHAVERINEWALCGIEQALKETEKL